MYPDFEEAVAKAYARATAAQIVGDDEQPPEWASLASESDNDQVGPYQLIREVGRGGQQRQITGQVLACTCDAIPIDTGQRFE